MKVRNHRLYNDDGTVVGFQKTPNMSGKLKGGKPKFIVIHFTANGTARSALNWLSNPKAKASAHLVIGHDGTITQMAMLNEKTWHAGRSSWKGIKGLNSHSVGIEIVNWGGLKGGPGRWKSWTGQAVPDDRVIEAAHPHSPGNVQGWEIYDEAQIDSTAAAVEAMANVYGIPAQNVIGHEDISPRRKTDPGPAWDMERFRGRVFGRDDDSGDEDLYEVNASGGLNMRDGPGTGHAKVEKLSNGTKVMVLEKHGLWWMVAKLKGNNPDTTGWVHSNWLEEA